MSILKFWLAIFSYCWMPLYIGGDKQQNTTSSTQNYDNRSIVTNTLDGGAIAGALGVATQAGQNITAIAGQAIKVSGDNTAHAYDYADNIFHSAVDFANQNDSRALNAYDRAAAITSDALVETKQAYQGAAAIQSDALTSTKTAYAGALAATNNAYSNATGQLQAAYADAKGTTGAQQKIIMAVLAVAGVFALASMHRSA